MGSHVERALLFLRQGRYDMAEESLERELAAAPDDPFPHALLALCRSERKQHGSAIEEARSAVSGGPDNAYYHFVLARVLHAADRNGEALRSVEEAIRLDPEDADHFWLLGALRFEKKDWQGALEAADEGLSKDPENVSCANLRAMALVQLGRSDAAQHALGSALEKDPENALTHANRGWALIHERKYKQSMESFREALRLDPTLDWAREGIVTALKAHNVVYGAILRYYLWMSKLSTRTQWLVLIGGVFLVRSLRTAQKANPAIAPYATPIIWAYFAFVLLSWIADPLFNLLLRLHPFGRHALTRKEVIASNCVGGLLLAGLITFSFAIGSGSTFLALTAAGAVALTIPVAATFNSESPRRTWILGSYTAALLLVGIAAVVLGFLDHPGASALGGLFVTAWAIFTWVSQFIR